MKERNYQEILQQNKFVCPEKKNYRLMFSVESDYFVYKNLFLSQISVHF
jgi:hypothetical protein